MFGVKVRREEVGDRLLLIVTDGADGYFCMYYYDICEAGGLTCSPRWLCTALFPMQL